MAALVIAAAYAQERRETTKSAGGNHLVVYGKMPLFARANGLDGELQLLQDPRLTRLLRNELWGQGDLNIDVSDPRWNSLVRIPLRNAAMRIVNPNGAPVQLEELERPLARMERVRLYGDGRETYLVTVDYSAGMGSYSGPATFLLEVRSGRLAWLHAVDSATGKNERIALARSLKTIWKIVDARQGNGKDLLEALCRPTFEAGKDDFELTYCRYTFDGKKWIRLVRERKGFSEFENGFPNQSLFP